MDGGVCGSDIVLEETFYIFSKKNTVYKVKLTEKGLVLEKESNGQTKTETIRIDDVVGARCMRSKRKNNSKSCVCGPKKDDLKVVEENSVDQDETDVSAYLYIYAYILKKYRVKSGEQRERMTITLRFRSFDKFDDNMIEAQRWRTAIRCLVKKRPIPGSVRNQEFLAATASPGSGKEDTRPLLILLNPKSGPGRAREVFQARVAPLLAEAEVGYDLHVTKHANYARDFVRLRDVFQWRGIVVVGGKATVTLDKHGDGILYEVLNGIFERLDWRMVLDELTLGIIPCGSGNGLAKAIAYAAGEPYDSNPLLVSALHVVRGKARPMDVVRVETSKETMFSFLSVGWGLIADIDIESEKLRAIGSPRFTLWSVARILGLRTYRGKIFFNRCGEVPSRRADAPTLARSCSESGDLGHRLPSLHNSRSFDDVLDGADVLSLDTVGSNVSPMRERVDSFYSVNSRNSAYYSMAGSSYKSTGSAGGIEPRRSSCPVRMYGPPSQLPALTQAPPPHWELIEGDFVMLHATYQSHIASDCFLVPEAKMDDGIIWLLIVRAGATRSQLLQLLLGLSNGTHVSSPQLEIIPCTAFRLEPEKTENGSGHLTVDGESVTYGPLQAEVVPRAAAIMAR